MPPVTQKPLISEAGLKAKNSIAEARQQVNLGATPAEARATVRQVNAGPAPRLNPTIPEVIPSTALAGNKTFEDVMDTRADLETQATAKQQLTDRIEGIGNRVNTTTTASFSDPDAIINRLALNRVPTETESQRAAKQASAVQGRRDYAGDIATARQELGTEYGLPDLTARKAEITTQYAERETKMNDDIKRLEENATKRGVPRQYVEAEKQKIKSDALEDLSNYAAIEAAISGSITEARSIINDSINDKKASFELENQAIQQEIDYLSTLVGEDNQREASQLQIALDERKRLQDAQLAKETAIKNYAADVAAEGADDGTINAILKSGTEEEALRYAAPFLGRTERIKSNLEIQKLRQDIKAGDEINTPTGQSLIIPSFDEWLDQKGASEPMQPFSPDQQRQMQKEYEEDLSIMTQANKVASLSPLAREIVNNPKAYYDLTPSLRGEIFDEMAKKGVDTNMIITGKKKALPATQAESLAQASGVKADVEKLYTMLKELPGTGPISGRLQALDPYNAKRVAIEAQITRIVPGLARGIFNEVGVLTDSDVTRYRDTLANPNMTDAQIEALHNDTMSKIDQSIGTTIDTFSSLGYDLGTYGKDKAPTDNLSDDEAYALYLKQSQQQ